MVIQDQLFIKLSINKFGLCLIYLCTKKYKNNKIYLCKYVCTSIYAHMYVETKMNKQIK